MTDSVPQRIERLSTWLEALEAAAHGLERDPSVGVSVRRIARSLEGAAKKGGLDELAAGAAAIQRAADGHLARSVANFLQRIEELRAESPVERATILVVEDDRTAAAATRGFLGAPGRDVVVAESAAEAESILSSRDVDLVVLDLILPDRDGRDVLIQMREDPVTATIPVIVLSSTATAVARTECLAVGADEFLEKPADRKTLRAAAVKHLRSGKARRDALSDGLTGLPNRAGITVEFERRRSRNQDGEEPLAIALITLDALDDVRRTLGHAAEDRYLLEVASALREAVGARETLGRWTSTQFIALLFGRSPAEARELLGATLRSITESTGLSDFRDRGIEIALRAGVAHAAAQGTLHDAVSTAERSLYTARTSAAPSVETEPAPDDVEARTILLVEDDRTTSTLIRHRLVRDGHEVVAFDNGEDAHAWASRERAELAILDVKVPGMDGFELLAKLRATEAYTEVPIIMLTSMGSEADVIRGLELGADDYMLKPFSPSELLARVRRLVHARATAGSGPSTPSTKTHDRH